MKNNRAFRLHLPVIIAALLVGFSHLAVAAPPHFDAYMLQGTNFTFYCYSDPGNTCRLETKNQLADPAWVFEDADTWVNPGGMMFAVFTMPTTNTAKFYRLYDVTAGIPSDDGVGYTNTAINLGSNWVVNPFGAFASGANTLGSTIPNPPDMTEVYLWENSAWTAYYYDLFSGVWYDEFYGDASAHPLPPAGTGFILQNWDLPFTLTFCGKISWFPTINTQPQSRTNLAGTTATFSVAAAGTAPLGYQWRRNSTNLWNAGNVSGAFSSTLTLSGVSAADAANYSVVITNSIGSVTSSVAILTVTSSSADVALAMTGPATVSAGSTFGYTLSVTNFGPASANSVMVTDSLPAGVSFVSASGGGVMNAGVVSWSLGALASGQVINLAVSVVAPASGSLTNVASVSSATSDPNPVNNVTPPILTGVIPSTPPYTWTTNGGIVTITGYTGPGGNVAIPDTITGLPVGSIGVGAFSNAIFLTSIAIPDSISSMGSNVFYNCVGLTSVTLGTNLHNLARATFNGCSNLASITIPGTLTGIGVSAFRYCTGLTNVTLLGGVANISAAAFLGCSSLGSIEIPGSVTNLGNSAFSDCSNLTGAFFYGNAPSTGTNVLGGDTNAIVYYQAGTTGWGPTFCGQPTVMLGGTRIIGLSGNLAFGNVTVGATATAALVIANSGNVPLSVSNISYPSGFSGTWSGSVSAGGSTNVTVTFSPVAAQSYGGAVTVVSDATSGASTLAISGTGTAVLPPSDFIFVTNNGAITITGYTGPGGNVTIPATIAGLPMTCIGASAFTNILSLNGVVIPNSVTSMGTNVFNSCSNLASVVMPDSLTSIEANTFRSCSSLADITIPNGITNIGNAVFYGCTGLTNIVLSTGLINIGSAAFRSCTALKEITIPGSVTSIGSTAFGYAGLTRVTIPNSVTNLGVTAFWTCTNLTSVTVGSGITSISSNTFKFCSSLTSVDLPNSLTNIGFWSFASCSSLTNIVIPASVTSIGDGAFRDSPNLASIYFYSNAPAVISTSFANDVNLIVYYQAGTSGWEPTLGGRPTVMLGGTRIIGLSGNLAFGNVTVGATATATLVIANSGNTPLTVSNISYPVGFSGAWSGSLAAGGSTNLTVTFAPVSDQSYGGTVTVVSDATSGSGASGISGTGTAVLPPSDFVFVTNGGAITITGYTGSGGAVVIPDTMTGLPVTRIGDGAFSNLVTLTGIAIPDSITSMGTNVFADCTSLTNVTIGASLGTIGSGAFRGCIGLPSIIIPVTVTNVSPAVFYGCTSLTNAILPSGITSIGAVTFNGCKSLKYIAIPGTVASIGASAFANAGLATVTIPDSVTSVGSHVFLSCSNLVSATVGNGITSMATNMFKLCTSLTSVSLPNTLTNIGFYAFASCSSLTNIVIPASVTSIGDGAFRDSPNLASIYFYSNAPAVSSTAFANDSNLIVYYQAGSSGWGAAFGGRPTVMLGGTRIIGLSGNLAFGNVTVGATATAALVIANSGNAPLTVSNISCPVGFSGAWSGSVAAGGSTNVTVTFAPVAAQSYGGMVSVSSDMTGGNGSIGISGTGTAVLPTSDFIFLTNNGAITITGYTGSGGAVVIPVTINDMAVISIGTGAFSNALNLTSITIPDCVTNIGLNAFRKCTNLTSVMLGNGLISIGDIAFAGCQNLTNIIFPESLISIGSTAFSGCLSLSTITIPASVMKIWPYPFRNCQSLTAINVDALNPVYSSTDGVLYDKDQTVLIECPAGKTGYYWMPGVTTNIGSYAFSYCYGLTNIYVSSGNISSIGDYAFYSCTNLISIYFIANAPSLGTNVFNGVSNAMAYYFSDNTNGWGSSYGGLPTASWWVPPGAYRNTNGLISMVYYWGFDGAVTVPSAFAGLPVISIAQDAFRARTGLTSVTIPTSITDIGDGAFADNASLTAIIFEGNAPSLVGSYVFAGDDNSTVYYFSGTTGWGPTFGGRPTVMLGGTRIIGLSGNLTFGNVTVGATATATLVIANSGNVPLTVSNINYPVGFSGAWSGSLDAGGSTNLTVTFAPVSDQSYGGTVTVVSDATSGVGTLAISGTGTAASPPSDFIFVTNAGAITITGYTGPGGNVAIPGTITGLPVVSIGDYAFGTNFDLTQVTIPDAVTNIGIRAFVGCGLLTNVNLGQGVTRIGLSAFAGCFELASINLPASLKTIETTAFGGCSNLAAITIPAGVTNLGLYPFRNCSRLSAITVASLNPAYSSVDGVLFDWSQTTLLEYPAGRSGFYSMPSGVTNVAPYAFSSCFTLTNITIPASMTLIGEYAFNLCRDLTGVYFMGNAPSVGSQAFYQSTNAIVYYQAGTIGWGPTFGGQPTVMLGGMRIIGLSGNLAFGNVPVGGTASATLVISNSGNIGLTVSNINYPAGFSGAWSGSLAAGGSTNVTVTFSPVAAQSYGGTVTVVSDATGGSGTLAISGAGYGAIPASDFIYVANNGVIVITGYTGSGGIVAVPGTISGYPVTAIGDGAFSYKSWVTGVIIPTSVTSIGAGAFFRCSGLTSVIIPNSVTNIGDGAFSACLSLTNIAVDAANPSYTIVSGGLFNKSLTMLIQFPPAGLVGSYAIPASVTSIGADAFFGCSGLTSVIIPNSVTNIGDGAFSACPGLTNIAVNAANPSYASVSGVLFNKTLTTLIQFPGVMAGSFAIPNTVTTIGYMAFNSCFGLTSVTIPNSVISIGDFAFWDCQFLTNATIGNSVTNIGQYAFGVCTRLKQMYFQGNAPSVGSHAFYQSTNAIVYYQAGTIGWGPTFGGQPTVMLGGTKIIGLSGNLAFGNVTVGATATATLVIANSGNVPLTVSNISYPSGFSGAWSGSIAAGGSTNVTVTFAPVAAQSYGGTVTVVSDATSGASTLAISGAGTAVLPPSDFIFVTNSGVIAIRGYTGSGGAVTIPDTINNLPVAIIGIAAFSNCTSLASITISTNVTVISTNAFAGCDSLTNVSITTPRISNLRIRNHAFFGCTNLAAITLPQYVTPIEYGAFANCASLMAITVNALNPSYSSAEGVLFDKSQATLIECPGGKSSDYTLPGTVNNIGADAFAYCYRLTNVILPGTITNLQTGAFQSCPSLLGVYFQGNAPAIGINVFDQSVNATVYFQAGTTGWGPTFGGRPTVMLGGTKIIGLSGNLAFGNVTVGATATATLVIANSGNVPLTVSNISYPVGFSGAWSGSLAAGGSTNLTVTFVPVAAQSYGGTVTVVSDATSGAGTLAISGTGTAVLPPSDFTFVTNGGAITITGYTGTGGIVAIPGTINGYPVTAIGDNAFSYKSWVTGVIIPPGVTSIGTNAFYSCYGLTNVMIPNGVTRIEDSVFFDCQNLANITIPNSVTSIGNLAFWQCLSLTNITIPNSVTNLGDSAFEDCYKLADITFSTNLTRIGNGLFFQCSALANIVIPDNIISIGDWAFGNCPKLTSLKIGTNVASIGSMAFGYAGLTNVMIPNSVTNIGLNAFFLNYSLTMTAITVEPDNLYYCSVNGVLFDKNQSILIQYPSGKSGSYYAIPNTVINIEDLAFTGCSLSAVTIPNGVVSIGSGAFSRCYGLTNVTIPNGVVSIGSGAFSSCGLTDIAIPNSVTNLGGGVFAYCHSLAGVFFTGNAPTLSGAGTFYDANNVTVYYLAGATGWGPTYGGRPTALWFPGGFATNNGAITLTNYTGSGGAVTLPGTLAGLPVTGLGANTFVNQPAITSVAIGDSIATIGSTAFSGCSSLAGVTIGTGVTSIGTNAFYNCTNLTAVYFKGNAPAVGSPAAAALLAKGMQPQGNGGGEGTVFSGCPNAVIYYLPGTTGWGTSFGGLPAVLWNPLAQAAGMRTNRFGFNITGATNLVIVVEACTNLANPVWSPVQTNTLTDGTSYFSDWQWTNNSGRFYRMRSP